jgi:hypothetical protein
MMVRVLNQVQRRRENMQADKRYVEQPESGEDYL